MQTTQQFDAIDPWHADVGNDAARLDIRYFLQKDLRGVEKPHVKAGGAQQEIEGVPHRRIVIYDIDFSVLRHASINPWQMQRAT
jgi:aromatic ring-cleaving dioxygenase